MEIDFIPFAHDYYIMSLPNQNDKMSIQNRNVLFDLLQYNQLDYRQQPISFAPVIRLFGYEKNTKERMCVHIHGYFPYFYIKIDELREQFQNSQFIVQFINTVHEAYTSTYLNYLQKQAQEKFKIIYNIELCQKFDFYGAHFSKQLFLKIYMYDKQYMNQLVMLLGSGAIMNFKFQAYEAHLTYFMHFYSDLNIYGMSEIKITNFTHRKRFNIELENVLNISQLHTILQHQQYSNLYKVSTCTIEIDCLYKSIQNEKYNNMNSINTLTQLQEIYQVKLTPSLNKLWLDEEETRSKFNIQKPVSFIIDTSKNSENYNSKVNQITLYSQQVKEHINQYQQAKLIQTNVYETKCFVNQGVAQTFFNGQQDEKELCKKSIYERFKEYQTRKKDLFELIKDQGNIDYEYEFDGQQLDQEFQLEEEEDQEEDIESILETENQKNIFDIMIENQKMKDKNKFRKKYHAQKNNIILKDVFKLCEYCHLNFFECQCNNIISFQKSQIQTQLRKNRIIYKFKIKPPSPNEVYKQLSKQQKLTEQQYAYYSNPLDLFSHYNVKSKQIPKGYLYTQLFDKECIKIPDNRFYKITINNQDKIPQNFKVNIRKDQQYNSQRRMYIYQNQPPSINEVLDSLKTKQKVDQSQSIIELSQYYYPSQKSNSSQNELVFQEELNILIFEAFSFKEVNLPDPDKDEITFLMINTYNIKTSEQTNKIIIIVDQELYLESLDQNINRQHILAEYTIILVQNEINLLFAFILLVHLNDPDFILSYDLESRSLYFIANRAEIYGIDLLSQLSRGQAQYDLIIQLFEFDDLIINYGEENIINQKLKAYMNMRINRQNNSKRTSFNQNLKQKQMSSKAKLNQINSGRKKIRFSSFIVGRVLINLWRNVATDLKIIDYSIENVYYEMFKVKIGLLNNQQLSQFYENERFIVYEYFDKRIQMTYDILEMMALIPRTIEIAKLFGCEYESIGFRGSQFKIESILNRVTKRNDYLLLSATRVQVATQKILECMPLVIEPPKIFTVDPVIVLDFQSLYPSIMIAYNLCYSTCIGSINELFKNGGLKRFGVIETDIDIEYLVKKYKSNLQSHLLITPNGVGFIKKSIREGIIPQILSEFLTTRVMIKKSTNLYGAFPKIQKQHSFHQLAIKLFMNVMYGYCGASFSGRMPSGDIADSVVEIGRTILNECIECINQNELWQAKVLYGDTDSLFITVPGRTCDQALLIGHEIATYCTSLYPYPIELKFEKVYESSLLVAKKRYIGNKYNNNGQCTLDTKGLELIRRDGFPALQKIQRKVIEMLFNNKDLSQIKEYMHKKWAKILQQHINIKDFIIAKEVKLGTYKEGRLPAHAIVATKIMQQDPMRRPKGGERVPYVVIQGQGTLKLADLVVGIFEFNPIMKLNSHYYIKQINAAIGRLFSCFDVDINDWYNNIPKLIAKRDQFKQNYSYSNANQDKAIQFTLTKYFQTSQCILCGEDSKLEICKQCCNDGRSALYLLQYKQNYLEKKSASIRKLCRNCCIGYQHCKLWSCSILFDREKVNQKLKQIESLNEKYQQLIEFVSDY